MQSPAVATTEAEKATLIVPASFITRAGAYELSVASQMPPDMGSGKQGQGWSWHLLSVTVGTAAGFGLLVAASDSSWD